MYGLFLDLDLSATAPARGQYPTHDTASTARSTEEHPCRSSGERPIRSFNTKGRTGTTRPWRRVSLKRPMTTVATMNRCLISRINQRVCHRSTPQGQLPLSRKLVLLNSKEEVYNRERHWAMTWRTNNSYAKARIPEAWSFHAASSYGGFAIYHSPSFHYKASFQPSIIYGDGVY
jgi:hypothetical protein